MTDGTKPPVPNDNTEGTAEETTDAATGGWERFGQRAEDEKRLDRGKQEAHTDGTSPAPDVDLLADSLGSLADTVSGRDTGEDPPTR